MSGLENTWRFGKRGTLEKAWKLCTLAPNPGAMHLIHLYVPKLYLFFFSKIFFIYSWETHTHTEAETQAEGEVGSMQGARRGTRFRIPRIRPWAGVGAKPLSHLGCPINKTLKDKNKIPLEIILISWWFFSSIEYKLPIILFFIKYSRFFLLIMLSHLTNYPSIVLKKRTRTSALLYTI